MKYETIGGETKDTEIDFVEVRSLAVGEYFKTKSKSVFQVTGEKCVFSRAGSSTRRCLNITEGIYEWKLCRLKVHKIKAPEKV